MNWFAEMMRIQWISQLSAVQLMYGVYRLSRLRGPIVSVLGGKGAHEEGRHRAAATRFATICAQNGYSVITGGGPGIMEAANCGVFDVLKDKDKVRRATLGFGVRGVDLGYTNPCADVIVVNYYFVREWLLIKYSKGFAFFPGGIGTVDELFSLLNLIKLQKLEPMPIVLVDSDYWHGIIHWYKDALKSDFITPEGERYFSVTNDIEEAFSLIASKQSK